MYALSETKQGGISKPALLDNQQSLWSKSKKQQQIRII